MSLSTLIMWLYQWSLPIIHKVEKDMACLSSFFIGLRISCPGFRPCTMDWGLPDQSLIRKLYYRQAYRPVLQMHFLNWCFFFLMTLAFVELLKKLAKNIIVQINQQCTFPSSYTHIFIKCNIATGKVDSNDESFSPWTDHHVNRPAFLLSASGPQFILEQTRASRKS